MNPHVEKMVMARDNVSLDDDISIMAELIELAKKKKTPELVALAILSQRIVRERARFCLRGPKVKQALGLIDKVISDPSYRKSYLERHQYTLLRVFPSYNHVIRLWREKE